MQDVFTLATNKDFLRNIVEADYRLPPQVASFAFVNALVANLASTDAELRDELSYMIIARAFVGRQLLSMEERESLLNTCLDGEHLFYCIGEVGTDSIFMRSFSLLILAALLYTDSQDPKLPTSSIHDAYEALHRYAYKERDWRGYVSGKGWAHAMAHLADALDECAQHSATTVEQKKDILNLVRDLARISTPLYHEEDMRLASVVFHIIVGKQVPDVLLEDWINHCFVERGADVRSWTKVTNIKNFLRSIYFLLMWDSMAIGLTENITDVLRKQDSIYLNKVSNTP